MTRRVGVSMTGAAVSTGPEARGRSAVNRRTGWIAYVGPFEFPWGQGTSRRVYGMAGSLAVAGYDVVVASGEAGPSGPVSLSEVDGPGSVSYLGMGERPADGAGLLARQTRWFFRWGEATVRWLDRQTDRPSHVVLYGGDAPYVARLRRWCLRNRVPLVVDVTDWYSPRQLRGGLLGPAHISAKLALRYYYPRCDGIMTMSSFLGEHYRRRGRPVLRVPPTLDVREMMARTDTTGMRATGLNLVYAGNPGRKDLIADMIRAVGRADPAGTRLDFRVLGPTSEQIMALLEGDALPRNVQLLGRLPQQEVPGIVRDADFSLLLRRPGRLVEAGFSTKLCESMATGTPVIANPNRDLEPYLRDGKEGLACPDHSVAGLVETLRAALKLTVPERTSMRQAARSRALESFDFRAYAEPLGSFFDDLRR
jgi:glycosyltransferase involved in cell wall biosynthesis